MIEDLQQRGLLRLPRRLVVFGFLHFEHQAKRVLESLDPGDVVVAFTDGLIEARNADGDELESSAVAQFIRGMDARIDFLANIDLVHDVIPRRLVRQLLDHFNRLLLRRRHSFPSRVCSEV